MTNLANKTALVTGASRGAGKGIALALGAHAPIYMSRDVLDHAGTPRTSPTP